MIQEIIEKIEKEIETRKNMPHNNEQVDICYGLNRAKELVSSMKPMELEERQGGKEMTHPENDKRRVKANKCCKR